MELLSLPPEVLEAIFSWLKTKDIISVSLTCKLFNQITHSDQLWANLSLNEFNLEIPAAHGFAQKFYKNVLQKFGHLLGLWLIHADCYGGLLKIEYSGQKLCGVELRLPKTPHLMQSLRPKTVFTIALDRDEGVVVRCCINTLQQHRCNLTYGLKALTPNGSQSLYLTRQCAEGVDSSEHQECPDFSLELERWLDDQIDMNDEATNTMFRTRRQLIYKYMVLRQMDLKTHYSRFAPPTPCPFEVPIQPGIFKGTYSAHGLEIVVLTYEDSNKAKAEKITGDPNVPAGQITFRADLPFNMYLSLEEQATLQDIEKIEAASSEIEWTRGPRYQPFVIPRDCEESHPGVPNYCRARFHGFGQVALEGFQNPSFIEGHWIVFDENLFGFLWISLKAFSFYHRIQE